MLCTHKPYCIHQKAQYVIICEHFIRVVNNRTEIYQDRANTYINKTMSLISYIAIFYCFRFTPKVTICVFCSDFIDLTFSLADTCFVFSIRVVFKGRKRRRATLTPTVSHRSIFCGEIDIDNSHCVYLNKSVLQQLQSIYKIRVCFLVRITLLKTY